MECSITYSQLQKIFLMLCSNCFIGIIPLFYIRVMYTYMYIHPSTLMLVLTPFFFCLLNPMCQVYLALLYIVYVYLTLLSVYIFRIKLLMLCLYTYAYCIYDIDVVYFMGLYIYHQRPTLCHRVERHYHGSLYFIFPYMKSLWT